MKKKLYVVGFAFEGNKVALIRKTHPEWQAGLLNGIGGHIEKNESPMKAMIREFEEETGLKVEDWEQFCCMEFNDAIVFFFRAFNINLSLLRTTTEEEIVIDTLPDIEENKYIYNIPYMLTIARGERFYLDITATKRN
jgi:8-oxo-dGTP diphosphatase